tara:strand:+ start:1317 stop:1724 length:408 start_codon:yes stop_codon:yes gene_type:complete
MSTKVKEVKLDFAGQVLKVLNRDESEVLAEQVTDYVADYIIQCESQISNLKTGIVPSLNLKLTQAERDLVKRQQSLDNSFLNLREGNFEKYINEIANAEAGVTNVETIIAGIKANVSDSNAQIEKFKVLLKKLKS